MTNKHTIELFVVILLTTLILNTGCAKVKSILSDEQPTDSSQTNISSKDNITKKEQPIKKTTDIKVNDLQEYVSRVGKRLMIVIEEPIQNYEFIVSNSLSPDFNTTAPNKITISRGMLVKLQDEAELAAVLSHAIANLKNSRLSLNLPVTELQAITTDKYSMTYMSRAGYDPNAVIELQELYLNPLDPRYGEWLNSIFIDRPPSLIRIAANKEAAAQLPLGLQRAKDRYQQNVGESSTVQ